MSGDLKQAVARRGSFVQTVKAVAWSFFGIRRSTGLAEDVQKLNPVHVIIAGVIGAALFNWAGFFCAACCDCAVCCAKTAKDNAYKAAIHAFTHNI